MSNEKPNVIFILSDQQRWDTVGCYGQKLEVTPNLDMMAQEGSRFEYALTCQPVCGPARACLQTGRYATETGCYRNDIALPLNEKTIAHYFSESGYEVGYVGKWHLASSADKGIDYRTKPVPPGRRGGYKDYWMAADVLEFTSHGYDGYLFDADMKRVGFKGYRADCITDFALNFINTRNREAPFFLYVSYLEPHHQNDRNRYEGPDGSKERFKGYEAPGDIQGIIGDWKENYPDYLGCCNSLDYNVGRIRDELRKLGISDNTVVFYTSDHGSHFRTRNKDAKGYDDYKRTCHEAAVRVPMIAYGPGFTGGYVIDRLVSLIDVPPTLLACAGIEKPSQMRGRALQNLVQGPDADWSDEVFIQISESQVSRAIRTRKWKYCISAPDKDGWDDPGSGIYVEKYLYDLVNDCNEQINLASYPEYAHIRAELSKKLKKMMKDAGEDEPVIIYIE